MLIIDGVPAPPCSSKNGEPLPYSSTEISTFWSADRRERDPALRVAARCSSSMAYPRRRAAARTANRCRTHPPKYRPSGRQIDVSAILRCESLPDAHHRWRTRAAVQQQERRTAAVLIHRNIDLLVG